jgi:hypothetical protein
LTTLFGTNALPIVAAIDAPVAPKKHGWLPLLVVLFLISYGLMTMLIVEQGRTIESQRALIRELFRDSTELSAVRQKAAQEAQTSSTQSFSSSSQTQTQIQAQTQARSAQNPSSQTRTTQHPSTQAPTNRTPSSQAGPQQQRTQSQSTKQRPDFKMPSKPAADLVDDVRTLITI